MQLLRDSGPPVKRLFSVVLVLPALALAETGEFDQGLKAYQTRSFEAAKSHFEAYLKTEPSRNLSRTLFYLGQMEADGQKSQNYYQALAAKFPKDTLAARANLALGQMAYSKADYTEARARFSRVAAQLPTLPIAGEAQYWLGICWLIDGKPEESRRTFFGLIKAFPNSRRAEWAKLGIGDSYFRQGTFDRALTEYQACETQHSTGETLPIVLFQVAQCFEKLGGKEEAQAYYQRVIEAAPNGYEAIEAKQRLATLGKRNRETPKSVTNTPVPNPIMVARPETSRVRRDTVIAILRTPRDTVVSIHPGLFLQVAAFTDPESGAPLKKKLAQNGYQVTSSSKVVSGRKYYTVMVGPFPSEGAARDAEQRLKQEEHISPIWIRN
jgi:TolA-binding protein